MQRAADTLYLLATFSIRTGQLEKALRYAETGVALFPDDLRQVENKAYTLLLQSRFDDAESILSEIKETTDNIEYLRGRLGIILELPKEECKSRLRQYLQA